MYFVTATFDTSVVDEIEDLCVAALGSEIRVDTYFSRDGLIILAVANLHLAASFCVGRKEIDATITFAASKFTLYRSFGHSVEIAELLEELKKYSERMDKL